MQKFLKEVTTILKENSIFHSVENAGNIDADTANTTDTYSVCMMQMVKPKKTRKKNTVNDDINTTKKQATATKIVQYDLVPLLQIKHTPQRYNLSIYINDVQVYNFDKFRHNYRSPGIQKKSSVSDTQKTLDTILDICIKKSEQLHLTQLRQVKDILKESKFKTK